MKNRFRIDNFLLYILNDNIMRNLGCTVCLSLFLFLSQFCFGQTAADAFAKYESKEYKASGQLYEQFLKSGKGTSTDYYNAACSWALAGDKKKAFTYLNQAITNGWANKNHLLKDSDLSSLHPDKRW
ncbi:MAG: TPR end-of-group domain-containing protein, partial [Rufibacter sp.]